MIEEIENLKKNGYDCSYLYISDKAKVYVERIEEVTDTPVEFIGTGPGREDIIVRKK